MTMRIGDIVLCVQSKGMGYKQLELGKNYVVVDVYDTIRGKSKMIKVAGVAAIIYPECFVETKETLSDFDRLIYGFNP
jgi:hypothetical protein